MSIETDVSDLVKTINAKMTVEESLAELVHGIAGIFRSVSSPVDAEAEKVAQAVTGSVSTLVGAVRNNTPAQAIPLGATLDTHTVIVTTGSGPTTQARLPNPAPAAPAPTASAPQAAPVASPASAPSAGTPTPPAAAAAPSSSTPAASPSAASSAPAQPAPGPTSTASAPPQSSPPPATSEPSSSSQTAASAQSSAPEPTPARHEEHPNIVHRDPNARVVAG